MNQMGKWRESLMHWEQKHLAFKKNKKAKSTKKCVLFLERNKTDAVWYK